MTISKQGEPRRMGAWVILTTRYGEDIENPAGQQLQQALGELFVENVPDMTEVDYAEHPNAWLRYGFDEGPMYVLDVYRGGGVIFTKYADQDYYDLVWEYRMDDVSWEKSLALWQLLAEGKLDDLRADGWEAGS